MAARLRDPGTASAVSPQPWTLDLRSLVRLSLFGDVVCASLVRGTGTSGEGCSLSFARWTDLTLDPLSVYDYVLVLSHIGIGVWTDRHILSGPISGG